MASSPPRRGAPACAGLVRELYGQGVSLADIRRRTGLAPSSIYWWIDREVAADGTVVFNPLPRRRGGTTQALHSDQTEPRPGCHLERQGRQQAGAPARRRAGAPRARLLERLWSTAEQQVALIEARMAQMDGPDKDARAADTEKDARALALIARTLRELCAVEDEARAQAARKGAAGKGTASVTDGEEQEHGAGGRDRDAFRRELARRLDRLRTEGRRAEPSE